MSTFSSFKNTFALVLLCHVQSGVGYYICMKVYFDSDISCRPRALS